MVLHHELTGPADAPKLLLAPSLGTSLRLWDGQLALAERLELVRFDHRGHGDSAVVPGPYEIADLGRDVISLMDALAIDVASFCGISIGGMVGIWLGAHAPERIDRLVLICTAPYMPPASAWRERASTVFAAGSTEPIADAVLGRWLTPAFAASHPEVRADLRAMLLATSPEGYGSCCGAIERMDLRAEATTVRAPTLVISGSDDPAIPVARQRELAAAIPGARHEIVAPAAHIAPVEQPGEVNRLIAEHLLGSD